MNSNTGWFKEQMLHCYKTPKNTLGLEFQSQNSTKKEKLIKEEDKQQQNKHRNDNVNSPCRDLY